MGLNGGSCLATLHIAAYSVVAHMQGENLLVVEHVLYHNDGSTAALIGLLVGMLFFLRIAKPGHIHTNAELLVAVRTFKNQ